MLTIACPNETLPEWRALVAALGEYHAFVSFLRNGDDIPRDIERALELLGLDKTTWRSVDGKTLEQIKQEKTTAAAPNTDVAPAKPETSIRLKLFRDKRGTVVWEKSPAENQTQPNLPKERVPVKKSGRRKKRDAVVQSELQI